MYFFPTLFFHIYMFFTLLLYVVLNSFPVRGSNRRPLGGCRVFFICLAVQDQGRFFSNGSFFHKKMYNFSTKTRETL